MQNIYIKWTVCKLHFPLSTSIKKKKKFNAFYLKYIQYTKLRKEKEKRNKNISHKANQLTKYHKLHLSTKGYSTNRQNLIIINAPTYFFFLSNFNKKIAASNTTTPSP